MRYAKFVVWSDEDKCFIGRSPELILRQNADESLTMDMRRGSGALIPRGDHDLALAQVQAKGPSRLGSQRFEPANWLCPSRWAANELDLVRLTATSQTP